MVFAGPAIDYGDRVENRQVHVIGLSERYPILSEKERHNEDGEFRFPPCSTAMTVMDRCHTGHLLTVTVRYWL
jgi:hypothetical protein